MESLIRTRLNEPSQARITSADILQALNDGQKDVAIKALCIESIDYVTLAEGARIYPFNGIKIKYARVDTMIIYVEADTISLTAPSIPTVSVTAAAV